MHEPEKISVGLSLEGCRIRQQRLAERLSHLALEGALIRDRRHIFYLTGFWGAAYHATLLYLSSGGVSVLALPDGVSDQALAADRCMVFPWNRLGTLVPDPCEASFRSIESSLPNTGRIGIDLPEARWLGGDRWRDISTTILELRRAKDPDEVDMICHAIRGCDAAYLRAKEVLSPGIREIDLYAEMQAAAIKEIGEPLTELGNDFQAGSPGGPPRCRAVQAGELMPLDVAVTLRGYRCDLCRTFVVNGQPTDQQREAAKLVLKALAFIEAHAVPGVSGRWLYDEVHKMLSGSHGWQFPHHLGHGTGLSAHEAPRLNPHWDDVLNLGDLIAVEPGLYCDELRGGVRIEDNYWIGPAGLKQLSSFPRDLIIPRG